MRFSTTTLVLGALAAGQATAASMYHGKQHNHAARHVEIMKAHHERRDLDHRGLDTLLTATDSAAIVKLGVKLLDKNPTSAGQTPWVGKDGQFTNEFINQAGEDLVLVLWGPAGSWVNAIQPQLTLSIASGSSKTVSFPIGWSGAWAPIYNSTALKDGQIFDTWGEGTFNPPYSVVDVSREVNMNGRSMSIVGPQCTTDMNTCVFKCAGNVDHCLTGYQLVNCATGSQAGANFGTYEGAASGGCGGMGNSANLKTYLG